MVLQPFINIPNYPGSLSPCEDISLSLWQPSFETLSYLGQNYLPYESFISQRPPFQDERWKILAPGFLSFLCNWSSAMWSTIHQLEASCWTADLEAGDTKIWGLQGVYSGRMLGTALYLFWETRISGQSVDGGVHASADKLSCAHKTGSVIFGYGSDLWHSSLIV